jgi:hypothetical protein
MITAHVPAKRMRAPLAKPAEADTDTSGAASHPAAPGIPCLAWEPGGDIVSSSYRRGSEDAANGAGSHSIFPERQTEWPSSPVAVHSRGQPWALGPGAGCSGAEFDRPVCAMCKCEPPSHAAERSDAVFKKHMLGVSVHSVLWQRGSIKQRRNGSGGLKGRCMAVYVHTKSQDQDDNVRVRYAAMRLSASLRCLAAIHSMQHRHDGTGHHRRESRVVSFVLRPPDT